jgi:protein SCO1
MNKTIFFFSSLLLVVAGLTLMAIARRNDRAAEVAQPSAALSPAVDWTPGEPIEHFTLTERSGQTFDSESLEGKVWVANFFFSSCPASCRKQNTRMADLQKELGPQGVRFVSITCDPETDTPETLAGYARSFNAHPEHWKFLTGDLTYISYIGQEVFNVSVMPKGHTEKFILVDQNGNVRGYYGWDDPLEIDQMKKTIRGLLDGSIAPLEKSAEEEAAEAQAPETPVSEEDEGDERDDEPPAKLDASLFEYEEEAAPTPDS